MPTFVFALLFNFVIRAIRAVRQKKNKAVSESLYAACFHAHMQYGANARRAISCAYRGAVNPVKLDVLYCTNYQARSQHPGPLASCVRSPRLNSLLSNGFWNSTKFHCFVLAFG